MRGLLPNREATVSSSPGVVQEFIKMNLAPAKVLIPSSELALPIIPQGLRQLGHTVDRLNVYGSDIPANRPEIKLESFDSVVFSSPSCVDNFFELFDTVPVGLEFETKGPTTAGRLAEVLEK
jgi:uroporphyrinogen-III synthase